MSESRVTGILSFYDEPIELLAACVSSLGEVVDHLVAVDGAYMLYPDAKPSSDPAQGRVIEEVCRGIGIGCTLHTPTSVWVGNEVQKRNHAIRLAEASTRDDGWYFAVDADVVVTFVAFDWFAQLEQAAKDMYGAAQISVREMRQLPTGQVVDPGDRYAPVRLLYRALPNFTYGPAHWTIHASHPLDPSEVICLWGDSVYSPIEAFDATHLLKADHRFDRPEYRRVSARQYYDRRERFGAESPGGWALKD